MRSRLTLFQLLCALGAAVPAAGQVPGPGVDAARALAHLQSSDPVRLHLPGEGRVTGRFLSASNDSIVLLVGRTRRVVPAQSPDSVLVGRSRGGRGAIIGGLAGVAVGLSLGAVLSSVCSDGQDSSPCYSYIPLGGLAGGAVGGLVGFGVGSSFTGYHRQNAKLIITKGAQDVPSFDAVRHRRTAAPRRGLRQRLLRTDAIDRPDCGGWHVACDHHRHGLLPAQANRRRRVVHQR